MRESRSSPSYPDRVPRRAPIVVALLLTGACGGTLRQPAAIPAPPPVQQATTTTAPPDYRGVGFPGVPGTTTTTVDDGPGQARLGGRVLGPDGPVGGAIVRLQRVVGATEITRDVRANADGSWGVRGIRGGVYRVRAWRQPDLAQPRATVLFLAPTQRRGVSLGVKRYGGNLVTSAIAPNPPHVGQLANLVVAVADRAVDSRGIVRARPRGGALVGIRSLGGWRPRTPNPAAAGPSGRASWQVTCLAAGPQFLELVIGRATFPLAVPPCAPPLPPPSP